MTRRHLIAVLVGLAGMLLALVPPLWIRATGQEVALALQPVDPLSLFRGNYVDLRYDVGVEIPDDLDSEATVFVVFDAERPANVLRVSSDRPVLDSGETCIRGRLGFREVSFPELEQYFVTQEDAREIERGLSELLGIVKTTRSCRAILVDLAPLDG